MYENVKLESRELHVRIYVGIRSYVLHLSYTGKKKSLKSVVDKHLYVNVRELVY